MEGLYAIAEIGQRHALRVAMVSLAAPLFFGTCADPAIVDNVRAMADGIEIGAKTLTAAVTR